jgi:hypothetical protein
MSFDLDITTLPWPKPNTELFGIDGGLIARIPTNERQWGQFADTYLITTKALVRDLERDESHLEETGTRVNYLVFPILFLFRHFLELRLKEIIERGKCLLDDPSKWERNHNLIYLWGEARKILSSVYPEDSVNDLECAELLIHQVASVDSDSFAFRYPTTKSGEDFDLGYESISIKQFSKGIVEVGTFLGSATFGISVYLRHKHSI